jgi:hypothetical protein
MTTATTRHSGAPRRRQPTGRDRSLPLSEATQRVKGPAAAAGAAVSGLAVGALVGAHLRARRRPTLLGLPLPRGGEVRAGAEQALRAGRRLYEVESDIRALREQAEQGRRQSPIEVLLSGLTSRRLPRRA